jgi:hypothetical protein
MADNQLDPRLLEKITDYSMDTYQTLLFGIRSIQFEMIKTKLWISSFFITLQLGIFQFFSPPKIRIFHIIPLSFGLISLVLSLSVFFYSIINLNWPNRGLYDLDDPEFTFAKCKSYHDCLLGLIYEFHKRIKENIDIDNIAGRKIRKMNIPLILALLFLLFSALIFYALHINLIP